MRQNYRSIKFWQRNWDNEMAPWLQWQSFNIAVFPDQECHNFKSQNFVIVDIDIGIDET